MLVDASEMFSKIVESRQMSLDSAALMNARVLLCILLLILICGTTAQAQVTSEDAVVFVNFRTGTANRGTAGGELVLEGGVALNSERRLEFTTDQHAAVLDRSGMVQVSKLLREADALSLGGWFLCRRSGEQVLIGRDAIVIGPLGERFLRASDRFINFCLGTDQRGYLMGTINGNGNMPFVHVTINDVPIQTWQQLVVVKDREGHHSFYQNGSLIHSDEQAMAAPSKQPWLETDEGVDVPVRLRMPDGGLMGEVWVVPRAISQEEVAADYRAKNDHYKPAPAGEPVLIRDMSSISPAQTSAFNRDEMRRRFLDILGPFPTEIVPLEPQEISEEDCGTYLRRKLSIQVQKDDRMPLFVLVPKNLAGPAPAIICFYGTTSGAGKLTTVGLSGRRVGDPPHPNLSFAIDMVEAGFIAVAPDYLRDGERVRSGETPYQTTSFYDEFPDWSVHGKDVWDTMRLVDFLQTLDDVDGERIGMIGHSYGGHSTIFAAALEERIRVAVANGPVSAFREHGMHWGVPKGASNSQSLPRLRPYILDPELRLPITFAEVTALIAPRPLLVGQAAGELRPLEEQNYAAVSQVYEDARSAEKVRYIHYAGDHDFPPEARQAAVEWFNRWFKQPLP